METHGTKHIFTYGSLMFPEVWERVVNRHYKHREAHTVGLLRRKISNSTYPVAFAGDPDDVLDGRLYLNVRPADLERLDRFEGDYYERKPILVTTGQDETKISADVFLLKPKYNLLAGPEDWSPRHFQKHELQRFIHTVYAKKFS